jgi:hypothetical protein
MSNLLAAIEAEQQRINSDYDAIKRNLTAGHYADVMTLGRALNEAASSHVADKLHDEWHRKGGK